jgi:hypothetical protein
MEHYDTQHNGARQSDTQHNNKKSGKLSVKCCFDEYNCPECPVSIVILSVVMLCVFMLSGITSALGPSAKQSFAISIFIAKFFSRALCAYFPYFLLLC